MSTPIPQIVIDVSGAVLSPGLYSFPKGSRVGEAIEKAGLTLKMESIRGGTDGSRLSFMGLPCPNLFAGEQAIHSKHEFISVQDMNKAVETMVHLVKIWEERTA